MPSSARTALGTLFILVIRLYRVTLAALLGGQCRFYPSCSRYAEQAIAVHGPWAGGWMTVRRLLRCHPWHPGGVDGVMPKGCHGAVDREWSEAVRTPRTARAFATNRSKRG